MLAAAELASEIDLTMTADDVEWNDAALVQADAIYEDPADLLQRFDESLLSGTGVGAKEAL